MTILQFANNALSVLASPITSADTTIYLQAGTGSLFPTPTSGQVFLATIYNNSSTSYEIVLVTARSGDTVTVVRAQENTTAQTWLTGNSFGMYPTKGTMQSLVQADQLQNGTYTYAIGGGTANALTAQITSNLTAIPDGMNFVIKAIATNTDVATLQLTLGSTILSAAPIIKGNSYPFIANDIWTNYPCIFTWSATLGAFILQNPGTSVVPPITTYSADYLVVAGGGNGGFGAGTGSFGGGGAGGLLIGTTTLISNTTYSFVIGAGAPTNPTGYTSTNGNNSTAFGLTAIGGGGGTANSGGSGGAGYPSAGSGTAGQGNAGGTTEPAGGGGGGAGAVGQNCTGNGANGGIGVASSITGTSVYYAGGGGGGGTSDGENYGGGSGGAGGGGNGGNGYGQGSGQSGTPGSGGVANTGGGGGGGAHTDYGSGNGGAGGSGVVYISVATSNYTGITTGSPTITLNGSKTVMKFTTSGTYTA